MQQVTAALLLIARGAWILAWRQTSPGRGRWGRRRRTEQRGEGAAAFLCRRGALPARSAGCAWRAGMDRTRRAAGLERAAAGERHCDAGV